MSPLYGPVNLPSPKLPPITNQAQLPIKVTTPLNVLRIQAIRLSGLKNKPSSHLAWLRRLLKQHDINPINLIVDLTNYIMLFWGIPCHAFDIAKSGTQLIWETNSHFKQFITLDNTRLSLTPGILMVNNPQKALSLSFLGGSTCAINPKTTDIIIEMAVYNPTRVRTDSRQLKTITEASIRLDKFLDPQLIPPAFKHLIYLILKHCGGQITSQLFEYYPQQKPLPSIIFDPKKPSQYAGITISPQSSLQILKKLGCQIKNGRVTPPSYRRDITIQEDLIEEVIRYHGYQKIPLNQPISKQKLPSITPPILPLIKAVKNILVYLGYDEVRSWPLVSVDQISDAKTAIPTQNSINSQYPYLRQSIIPCLIRQQRQYQRYKLFHQQFFEIGKIYHKVGKKYQETYSLAFHHPQASQLEQDLDFLLHQLGLSSSQLINLPLIHQHQSGSYVELVLDSLAQTASLPKNITSTDQFSAYELKKQIVTLDANLNFKTKQNPQKLIHKYSQKIGKHLWQIVILDLYQTAKGFRYTLRVSYFNLSSAKAKSLHFRIFKHHLRGGF